MFDERLEHRVGVVQLDVEAAQHVALQHEVQTIGEQIGWRIRDEARIDPRDFSAAQCGRSVDGICLSSE